MKQDPALPHPMVVIVMGVSGSGKTTAAKLLAAELGWEFREGDDLHPPANVERMRTGIPLIDEDRWPWLHRIAAVVDDWLERGVSGVLTCSALKRSYRDMIIGPRPNIRLVHIQGGASLLSPRLASRQGHYMPSSLLASQFATLEPPGEDEHPITLSADQPPERIVAAIIQALAQGDGARG
ncbi:gluconokinase [Roseomonas xinghualingensis]|uniref:gluconokinase n=1 Tax=Roseomonas xinghualingensis TaxID=2986475 RepID=UPI0021F22C5C|nr:gluconokinase [Roseomonas sp. SXEYE001]MCV4209519.1 gluconokinase [Roseomonas sp. SXEYE001]